VIADALAHAQSGRHAKARRQIDARLADGLTVEAGNRRGRCRIDVECMGHVRNS